MVPPRFTYCDDPYAVAEGADALVLATDWPEYRSLDFARLRDSMRRPLLLDAGNVLDGPVYLFAKLPGRNATAELVLSF